MTDLAEDVEQELVSAMTDPVHESQSLSDDTSLHRENSLFTKIRFSWKPEDKAILERIRIASDGQFTEICGSFFPVIDTLYAALWVPETNEYGITRHTGDGRVVWKTDTTGNPVEDLNQLTGQDIEQALTGLQKVRLQAAPVINELFLQALYARHVASDSYDDSWVSVLDGTQGDRTARSNRESREDRYHAYFRYVLWSTCNTFLMEINQFMKRLEKIRDWRTWDSKR